MQAKKQRKQTEGGFFAQSFPTLLQTLATQVTRIRLRPGKRRRWSCWAFRV